MNFNNIKEINSIQCYIDQIHTLIQNRDPTMIHQTWKHITEINLLLHTIEPWCNLSKIEFYVAQEQLESYILSSIYPIWITPKMITDDQVFYDKVANLSSLITLEFMSLSLSTHSLPLIENAIDELRVVDLHNTISPMRLMYHIHECCNSLFIAFNDHGSIEFGADNLISALVYVIIQVRPQHLISICQWIEDWYTPEESRSGEFFCMYTNLIVAIAYISSLEPESELVKVDIYNDNPPEMIAQRLSQDEYKTIIQSIRQIINHQKENEERAKGAGIGATIGMVVASPLALISAFVAPAVIIPMSIGIITAGFAIGSTFGAIVPLTVKKSMNEIIEYTEHINTDKLQKHGITLVNPFVTNRIYLVTVSLSNVKFLEFAVKSLRMDD